MLPYILLILLPIPFAFVCLTKQSSGNPLLRMRLTLRNYIGEGNDNLLLAVFFIFLFILLVCRGDSVGSDTSQYRYLFRLYGNTPMSIILDRGQDVIFRTLTHFIYLKTGRFRIFLAVMSFLEIAPVAYVYLRDKRHSYLKMILFVNMPTFAMMFSGIRQAIAISFGVLAYDFISKKKLWGYIICAIIAYGFHSSAFVILLLYPISKVKLKRKSFIFVAAVAIIVFIYNQQIFTTLMDWYLNISVKEYDSISDTGAYASLILFILFAAFSFFISDDDKMDDDAYSLRSFLVFTVLFQSFSLLHTLAMRVNYYFVVLIPLVIAKSLECRDTRFADIAKMAEAVMCGFFTAYFVYCIVSGATNSEGFLRIFPYTPFWKFWR